MSITTINPTTGALLDTYESHTDDELDALLARAHQASLDWGTVSVDRRAAALNSVASVLRKNANEYAALMTAEMGKPITESRGEIEKCAVTADFYAAHAARLVADEPVPIDESIDAWIAYEPIGLVYAVMPWNFPFWQAMRFALPAIAAGNGVFLKHSPNVSGSAITLERLWREAGLPDHVFTTLLVEEDRVPAVSDRLIADDRIAAVTLTGSNRAGEAVGAAAGRAVKKAVLELGGSDAFVVLDDADLDSAVATAVRARFHNSGQSCVCAKRFVISSAVADRFIESFIAGTKALAVGDPTSPTTQVGPVARDDLRAGLQDQVDRAVASGAKLLTGGRPLDTVGYFYEPTALLVDGPGSAVFDEETFGPVAAIAVATDDDDAVRLANATPFGLGLSLWTTDQDRARSVARRITTGAAFVNAMVASDARVPFGGTKRSGHGRELAAHGLREFVNIRTYWTRNEP